MNILCKPNVLANYSKYYLNYIPIHLMIKQKQIENNLFSSPLLSTTALIELNKPLRAGCILFGH